MVHHNNNLILFEFPAMDFLDPLPMPLFCFESNRQQSESKKVCIKDFNSTNLTSRGKSLKFLSNSELNEAKRRPKFKEKIINVHSKNF